MTMRPKTFKIQSANGSLLGICEAITEMDALDVLARRLGYRNYDEECRFGALCKPDQILVTEVVRAPQD